MPDPCVAEFDREARRQGGLGKDDDPGQAFGLVVGGTSSGKTSLLKLLYLARRPTRGIIRLFGEDAVTLPRKRLPPRRLLPK